MQEITSVDGTVGLIDKAEEGGPGNAILWVRGKGKKMATGTRNPQTR